MNLSRRLNLWSFSLFLSFCGLSSTICFGQEQDLPHNSASTGADGALFFSDVPGDRQRHAMAYDSSRQTTLMLGDNDSRTRDDEIWEYDGTRWNLAGNWANRSAHAMAYDSARNVTVIFGGVEGANFASNATYEYDGTSVVEAIPASAPQPNSRTYHSMAYDSGRDVVVLFGGIFGSTGQNDTWEYDGTSWTEITTATTPSNRYYHAMAYDSVRGVIVLFGGTLGISNFRDTWEYDGVNWTQVTTEVSPSNRGGHAMVYDSARNVIVLFGGGASNYSNETWEYDGVNWTQVFPATSPEPRSFHAMVYDSNRNVAVLYGGNSGSDETWEYDGTDWTQVESVASTRTINMADKSDGIWNYTSIYVGKNVAVKFELNGASNTPPVQWLATDNVIIEGALNLDGQNGLTSSNAYAAAPGPGGYAGGLGGEQFNVSGSYAGTPGLGPGGGAPGISLNATGQPGVYSGNAFLQPLLGGSGGGGRGSSDDRDGDGGGAGGGAILIDSSRDITINGLITAKGGASGNSGGNFAYGSGGAIRLVADRIAGTGVLRADSVGGNDGRIRLEAYYRPFFNGNRTNSDPIASASAPVANSVPVGSEPQLVITSVDGMSVLNPPTGSLSNVDVIFSNTGPVDIIVNATNVPDGSTVDLNVFTSGEIIAADPQILAGGTATFTVTVPAGVGHLQASSSFLPTP